MTHLCLTVDGISISQEYHKKGKICLSSVEAWDLNSLIDLWGYRCPGMHYTQFGNNQIYPFPRQIYSISGKKRFYLRPESNQGVSFLSHSLD
jgi:hypothetical protein